MLLLELPTGFWGARLGGLVFPSFEEFPSLLWSIQSKSLAQSMKQKWLFFLEFSCFFFDPVDVGNLVSCSFDFSKSNVNICKFSFHVPLDNFEHNCASIWDECNCAIVWTLWNCLSLGLEWKLTFSSPVATAEFSKFADILSAALSQHHI